MKLIKKSAVAEQSQEYIQPEHFHAMDKFQGEPGEMLGVMNKNKFIATTVGNITCLNLK